ncbi:MAG TPA: hypothetical protein VLH38_00815 [Patescibacteria group bacterium]|nr:hypothetical protein [Patescibacteria group bacterium]
MPRPTPTGEWEHNLNTTTRLLKKVVGCAGVTATYGQHDGLTLVVRRRWAFFRKTVHCPATQCTPAIAANIINRVGLGDYRKLLALIGASNEVSIQRDKDGMPGFTASGKLST